MCVHLILLTHMGGGGITHLLVLGCLASYVTDFNMIFLNSMNIITDLIAVL